jgi:phenylpropionate dioxygenase-like ring-hydroxylating dioxygenase large terminal subunit
MTMLNPDVMSRMADHLASETTDQAPDSLSVPIANYIDPKRLEAEVALLRRVPVIAARFSELPEPGNFITREVLGTPLIIARRTDGSVAGYVNMCRHRGGRVEREECGSRRTFVCRYHGWTYGRDNGDLRHVPYESSFGDFDRADFGLRQVPAEERHGFVWLNFSADDKLDVASYLGSEVDEQLTGIGLENATTYRSETFSLDINWKVILDGATDMLHPRFLHPQGVGKLLETNVYVWKAYGRHGHLFAARRRLRELIKAGEVPEDSWKYVGGNLFLYPNSLVITAPDHAEVWNVWPDVRDPNKSTVTIRFIVRPEILDERIAARIDLSWEILQQAALEEDFPVEQSIQDNIRANPTGSFLYGRNEAANQHIHRQLQRDLGDS